MVNKWEVARVHCEGTKWSNPLSDYGSIEYLNGCQSNLVTFQPMCSSLEWQNDITDAIND
jgi:hypothetical protein